MKLRSILMMFTNMCSSYHCDNRETLLDLTTSKSHLIKDRMWKQKGAKGFTLCCSCSLLLCVVHLWMLKCHNQNAYTIQSSWWIDSDISLKWNIGVGSVYPFNGMLLYASQSYRTKCTISKVILEFVGNSFNFFQFEEKRSERKRKLFK